MPHGDMDYLTAVRKEVVAGGNDLTDLEHVDVGPDPDELWDILRIRLAVRGSFEGSTTDSFRAEVLSQLHTNANEILGPAVDAIDTTFETSQDQRVLGADQLSVISQIEDQTNGTGAGPHVAAWEEVLHFDPGDLRIGFPGSLSVGHKVDNDSTGEVEVSTTLSVSYLSEVRDHF